MGERHKILVFRIGQLGDSLISLPAFHAIRARWPAAHITLLFDQHVGRQWVLARALLEGTGLVDDYIPYPVGHSAKEKREALREVLRLIPRLRKERFDWVVHLEPEFKSVRQSLRDRAFFRLAGIRRQITTVRHRKPRAGGRPLEPLEHETDFFLRALKAEGFVAPDPGSATFDLHLGEDDAAGWKALRADSDVGEKARLVGVGVGSKMQAKRWPLDRFEKVLMRLIEVFDIVPVFLGGPEDSEASQGLAGALGRGIDACGRLSLRGSVAALADCEFYLGNDTGTMHLAVAAGRRCVVVFSARDVPGKWYPYGSGHRVHRVPVDCEGCMLYTCIDQGRKCLMAIGPDEVYQSCAQLMESLRD